MALMMQCLVVGLLPWAFLLPPGVWAGEIVGGKEAKPHSRPYMAYLLIKKDNKNSRCGGFLVAENFVLTAAHCQGASITVTLGAHNIDKREQSRQKIPVLRQIPHPQYDNKPKNNDIMLLQLSQPAKLNQFVKTIPLPSASEPVKRGEICSTAGWGLTIATDPSSLTSKLQEVNVTVMDDAKCKYPNYNKATMLCVGDPREGKDSAKGDSGGPLVCGGKAQGVVSWGPDTPPGVYMRIITYSKWIQDTMSNPPPWAPPGVMA